MEDYKKAIQRRIRVGGIYCAIIIILVCIFVSQSEMLEKNVPSFIVGFDVGFFIGLMMVVVFFIGKYITVLKSEEKLKKLYIEENDERGKHIRAQMGGTGNLIILGSLACGVVISGFFSFAVFITLLCVLMFSVFVQGILKLYYRNKY